MNDEWGTQWNLRIIRSKTRHLLGVVFPETMDWEGVPVVGGGPSRGMREV